MNERTDVPPRPMAARTALLAAAVLLGGCAVQPVAQPVPFQAQRYDSLYHRAVQALRDAGFEIDRQDYRFGVVTTHPLGAPTVFEPWNQTNTTLGQIAESTVNDQRRVARVYLEPAGSEAADKPPDVAAGAATEAEDYQLRVEVLIERRSMAARRVTSSTSRARMFNNLRQVPTHLRDEGITRSEWIVIGRDEQLESRLLADIAGSER